MRAEPEVLFDGGHHADEHMGVEMVLKIMRWLVDGYGTDTRITNIVNGREIWLVFSVNPDGADYDIAQRPIPLLAQEPPADAWDRLHRHRPQPQLRLQVGRWRADELEPGGDHVPRPESVLGARDPRDARLPGEPRRRQPPADPHAHHVPRGRPAGDVAVRLHLRQPPRRHDRPGPPGARPHRPRDGRRRTATSPSRRATCTSPPGTTRDYAYGVYRIFSYTFEMSNRDYMDDSLIASETGRNKSAVLYLAERAWCPYSVLGASYVTWRCGAFDDDFEAARGWVTNPGRHRHGDAAAHSHAATPRARRRAGPSSSGRCRRARGR